MMPLFSSAVAAYAICFFAFMVGQIHGHSARGQQTATGSGEDLDETADCQRMMNTFMTVCVLKSKQGGGVQPSPGSGSGSANKECRQIEDAWLDRCIETTTPKLDLSGSGSGSDLDWFGPKKPWKDEDDGLPMADQAWSQAVTPLGAADNTFMLSLNKESLEAIPFK